MSGRTAPPRETCQQTVERLRDAAKWCELAAQDLERGDVQAAGQMAHLGRVCVEDAEQHVAALEDGGRL